MFKYSTSCIHMITQVRSTSLRRNHFSTLPRSTGKLVGTMILNSICNLNLYLYKPSFAVLYSWGNGNHGQLGHAKYEKVCIDRLVHLMILRYTYTNLQNYTSIVRTLPTFLEHTTYKMNLEKC